jgi:phage terminase large subunit
LDKDLDALAKELLRRQQLSGPNFRRGAFPEQVAFLEDPFQFKMAHCSRGAAKSYTAGIGIYEFLEKYPGCSCFYVTKTHDMARNIMWFTVMQQIAKDFYPPDFIDFNETLLEGRHPNGSKFRLTGIDGDRKQQDKLLGGKYKLVVLDEVAFFETDLTEIIYRTLIPAVGRIGGSIWLLSTSSDFPRGLFYEATRPEREERIKGWNVHEWQWKDNPYVRDEMQKTINELIAANPLITETNHFRQHYLNEWVIDDSKLVYRFNPSRNLVKEIPKLPKNDWVYTLGVDTGWEDDNAFVLTGYHAHDPALYVIKSFSQKKLTFDQVIEVIQGFLRDTEFSPHKVFIDGANKQGVESMRVRSSIPFEYADKQDKATFIEICNGDLVQGKIRVHDIPENKALCSELSTLVWQTEGDRIKFPKKEHPSLPNHLCDAFLYAWRNGYHYHSSSFVKPVVVGSREWYQRQSEEIWEKERERLIAGEQQGEWPEDVAFGRF